MKKYAPKVRPDTPITTIAADINPTSKPYNSQKEAEFHCIQDILEMNAKTRPTLPGNIPDTPAGGFLVPLKPNEY